MIPALHRSFVSLRSSWVARSKPSCSSRRAATVWSFGDGSNGAVGSSTPFLDVYEPERVGGLAGEEVVSVAAGHYHSLAVTAGGHVWAWGRNVESQLSRAPNSPRDTWGTPEMVMGLDNVNARAAFASGVVSAAIGSDGSLWVWGRSKRGQLGLGEQIIESVSPSKVEELSGEDIVKVSFGWGHALALTKEGKLFSWGYAENGRLGQIDLKISPKSDEKLISSDEHQEKSSLLEVVEKLVIEKMDKEKSMPILWKPTLVSGLIGRTVTDVACGLDHSIILCGDGTLLTYGDNTYGQLGRDTASPEKLKIPGCFDPIYVSAGVGHSLALCRTSTREGEEEATCVLSWGWNHSGQLGRCTGREDRPSRVDGFEGEKVVSVSAGRVHSVGLSSKGEVWTWGSGLNGRLGLGSAVDERVPARVEALDGLKVLQAVSGADHTLLLVSE